MNQRKILIIDDDPSVRDCYGRLFRRAGYEPRLESCGWPVVGNPEAYRDIAVVVLDYRMPGLDGLEILRRLRRRDFTAPGLMVTAFATAEVIEEARMLGIREVFSKPVKASQLLRAVKESLPREVLGEEEDDGRPIP